MNKKLTTISQENDQSNKILLTLLPYWTPLIPPIGILSIKTFLAEYGYPVKVVDSNTEEEFKTIYNAYFKELDNHIPRENGNIGNHFHNIGNNILHDHMLIFQNHEDKDQYRMLLQKMIYNTFFCKIGDNAIDALTEIIRLFYKKLERYIIDLVDSYKPTIIGLSVYKHTLAPSLFVFKLIKRRYPCIRTVMGGGIFTQTLSVDSDDLDYFIKETEQYIDKILIGEGELLFLKLLRNELPQDKRIYTLEDIGGETVNLRDMGSLDFSNLDLEKYPIQGVSLSRGCPFKCNFCAETVIWQKYREKGVKQFVNELRENYDKYNRQFFWTCDSLVNVYISEVATEIIESKLPVYWDGYLRADKPVCDINNTLLWRKGGFYKARIGVESGSQRILDAMNKKITVEQIEKAVTSLAYAGIKTTTYWVIGYPGETEEDFEETLKLLDRIKDDIYEAMCEPFYYFLFGQVKSEEWLKENNIFPLYTEAERKMLITQTWELDCEPSREVRYRRLNRFVEYCESIGILTPYTMKEIDYADNRWKKLHKNSVPSMSEFVSGKNIKDNDKVEEISFLKNVVLDENEFLF